jgi:SAM-dependent methyltransferase
MNRYREIYKVEKLPVTQNRMFTTRKEALNCATDDVVLVQDTQTGLIFNQVFKPSLMKYASDYQNEQAVSFAFKKHIDEVTQIIQRNFFGKTMIEIGCGKGFFLEYLLSKGFDIKGIDPAYEGKNPAVFKVFFEKTLGISGEGVILRHVLEHIPDPVSFLYSIKTANGGGGVVYIEVPCFDWICKHRAWFDIHYEHVNYFRLNDFYRMFEKVFEAGNLFNGQYLYVVADLATLKRPECSGEDGAKIPADFLKEIDTCADIIKNNVSDNGGMKQSAVWGGASKGVIFALYMQRVKAEVDCIIDINPAKQGKYISGSGILIHTPQEASEMLKQGSNVFVMNPNYLSEIVTQSGNKFNYLTVGHE